MALRQVASEYSGYHQLRGSPSHDDDYQDAWTAIMPFSVGRFKGYSVFVGEAILVEHFEGTDVD